MSSTAQSGDCGDASPLSPFYSLAKPLSEQGIDGVPAISPPRGRERKRRNARVCSANRGKYENLKATMHRLSPKVCNYKTRAGETFDIDLNPMTPIQVRAITESKDGA